jgi:hypothetical protein
MKFSLATVAAVAGLFATVLAGPVPVDTTAVSGLETRQYDGTSAQLDKLSDQVSTLSDSIKTKLSTVPDNASDEQKEAAANSIAPDFTQLQQALSETNKLISANGKRSDHLEERGGCPSSCVTNKANKIVVEISITIKLVVKRLGRDRCSRRFINPLLLELKALLVCLDRLVAGLLRLVGSLLCTLLGGLGLDDLLYSLLGNLLGGLLGGLIGFGNVWY